MAVTPTPTITALPAAPQRLTDTEAQFVAKADAFADALAGLGPEVQATAEACEANATFAEEQADAAAASATVAVGSTSYAATSASAITVGTGAGKTLTLDQTGKGFAVNDQVSLVLRGDDAIRMRGTITAFNAGTGAMTFTATEAYGSGSQSGWAVMLTALEGLSATQAKGLAIAFAVAL